MNLGKLLLLTMVSLTVGCAAPRATVPLRETVPVPAAEYAPDAEMVELLAPYRAEVAEWEVPLGTSAATIPVQRARHELGALVADAMLKQGRRHTELDAVFTNSGGIRSTLPAGPITLRNISEILPFENRLVVLTLSGDQVRQVAAQLASSKGSNPVSGLEIHGDAEGNLLKVLVNGAEPEPSRSYRIATNSFLATGAGGFEILPTLPQTDTGLLVRDLVVEEIREASAAGRKIEAPADWNQRYHFPKGDSQ